MRALAMLSVVSLIWTVCGVLTVIQLFMATKLFLAYLRPSYQESSSDDLPKAMAILCLRGTDPFLPECLRRLVSMNYTNYFLRIVIDSARDPARHLVQQFLDKHPKANVEVTYLRNRLPNCSGKVSGLLQATEDIPMDCQVVAFFDGDTMVYPDCLRDLVAPLRDPKVGITSGNRWYAPQGRGFASLVRYGWNSIAVSLMNVLQFPWGGCMAMRAETLRDEKTRRAMRETFNEDATLGSHVLRLGMRVEFVSEATIVNHENIAFPSFYNFLVRQLLVARSSYFRWPLLFGQSIGLNSFMACWGLMALPIPHRDHLFVALSLVSSVLYLQAFVTELFVRRVVAARGEKSAPWKITEILGVPAALACVCVLNFRATTRALIGGFHTWRGITYEFNYRRWKSPISRIVAEVDIGIESPTIYLPAAIELHRELPMVLPTPTARRA